MIKKLCPYPSCNTLIEPNEKYCEKHMPPKRVDNRKNPFEKAKRYNTEFYNTSRWRHLRKKILSETPYCVYYGMSETKLHVHHKRPPRGNEDLFFDETNCVPVCHGCHGRLTRKEIGSRYK